MATALVTLAPARATVRPSSQGRPTAPAHEATDPYAALVTLADLVLMRGYDHARSNARRLTRIAVALLPIALLMVSSCKTVETAQAPHLTQAEQVRAALVPAHAAPAHAGRARDYVAAAPETLTMLTAREIGYLYGQPSFVRKDAQAQVWQYKTDGCVVDFYIYGEKTGGNAVSYVDVRRAGVLPVGHDTLPNRARTDCLRGLSDAA